MIRHLHDRHFTPDEARRELSRIRNLIEEIVVLKQRLDARGFDIYRHEYFGGTGPNGDRYFPQELERLVELARVLNEDGILIKGFDEGLIDFPALRSNDEEVYLCWKIGEPDILFWHRIADGFAGRRPVQEF